MIDEAHLLYQEATEAFSEEVDALTLDLLLADLRGRRRQRSLPQRLRAAARRLEPDQARAVDAAADACERAAGTLPDLILTVADTLALLGRASGGAARRRPGGRHRHTRGPGARTAYNTTVWVTPGLRELPAWDPFCGATSLLAECLDALSAGVAGAVDALPDEHREHAAVVALADDAARLAALLSDLPESGGADHVVWGEIEAPGEDDRVRTARWTLARTPLTPARHVREALWDRLRGAVLTSATLTVRGSFAYYREMTGLDADVDVEERVFPSPFDFSRQAVLVLEHDPGRRLAARRPGRPPGRAAQAAGGHHRRPHAGAVHQQARHDAGGRRGGPARGGRRRPGARPGPARQRGGPGRGVPHPPIDDPAGRGHAVDRPGLPRRRAHLPGDRQAAVPSPGPAVPGAQARLRGGWGALVRRASTCPRRCSSSARGSGA